VTGTTCKTSTTRYITKINKILTGLKLEKSEDKTFVLIKVLKFSEDIYHLLFLLEIYRY